MMTEIKNGQAPVGIKESHERKRWVCPHLEPLGDALTSVALGSGSANDATTSVSPS